MRTIVPTLLLLFSVCLVQSQTKTIKIRKEVNQNMEDGKNLFKKYCSPCHSETDQVYTGPSLIGVTKRLDIKWLIAWTKSSTDLIKSGDKYAIEIYKRWGLGQSDFKFLSDKQIKNIFVFVDTFTPSAKTNK